MLVICARAFHSGVFEVQRYNILNAIPNILAINFQMLKSEVYVEVYDRYMLGTCSSNIYLR